MTTTTTREDIAARLNQLEARLRAMATALPDAMGAIQDVASISDIEDLCDALDTNLDEMDDMIATCDQLDQ